MNELEQQKAGRTEERTSAEGRCPECNGDLIDDPEHGETVCSGCGLVVEEAHVDHGPEWRTYEGDDAGSKSRVGGPMTFTRHDKGLTTTIGEHDYDARGRAITGRKRQQLHRLRTWQRRCQAQGSAERNLQHALGEIDRMASALGLPDDVRETAGVIYRRALADDLLKGRSIEAMATASLYAATRQVGIARSVGDVATVSRIGELEFTRAYRYLTRELGLRTEPNRAVDYLDQLCSELDVSTDGKRQARELLVAAEREGVHSGRHPVGLAAAAVYAAGRLRPDDRVTQSVVAETADVSEVTIRNRYPELLVLEERS